MSNLGLNIKKKLTEHKVRASALEKKAGIRPSSLQNIIQGRSKNPRVDILQKTAQALSMSISELLEEKPISRGKSEPFHASEQWDQGLYIRTTQTVFRVYEQKNLITSKEILLQVVEEIYAYCAQYNKKAVDDDFVDWLIQRLIQA